MKPDNLAPVYLDNEPVPLQEPKPKVAAILSHFGKPDTTVVKWLKSRTDTQGKFLRSGEVVDRTSEPNKPIYLTSAGREGMKGQEPKLAKEEAASDVSLVFGSKARARQEDGKEASGTQDMGKKVDEKEDIVEASDEEGREKKPEA